MIGDVELSHDFGKGIGDAGRELEQGKPLEMASLCSFLRLSGFFCSLSSLPAWMVFCPVPSSVTLVFACWLPAHLAVLGGGTCEHAVPALGGQG